MPEAAAPPNPNKSEASLPGLFRLDGRVAVVTGAAGLLGAEFSRTLLEAGANVIAADRDIAAAQALVDRLVPAIQEPDIGSSEARTAAPAMAVLTDVTDITSVKMMVQAALDHYGRLDILVNSAALDPKFDPQHLSPAFREEGKAELADASSRQWGAGAFEDFPLAAWEQALAVNLTGVFLCCQAAVQPMLAQGGGVIINLSSIYGIAAPDQRLYQRPGQAAQYKPVYYSVTKAGILGLTRYLAAYYAGKNIRVNALTPGGVFNGHDEGFVQAYSARTILGRMAEKDEMNGALLFLASDASRYMTGANLIVDGGWTAW